VVKTFSCPSNPFYPSGLDEQGFGITDYGATVYTDIDPATGYRNKTTRANGALHCAPQGQAPGTGTAILAISDGTSNTIAIAEDVGRTTSYESPYVDPVATNFAEATQNSPDTLNGSYPFVQNAGMPNQSPVYATRRQFGRWAEPDSGYGVSGFQSGGTFSSANGTGTPAYASGRAVNNTPSVFGSATTCIWATVNNCGNDDEIFSFHGDGANCVYCDGHVVFLNANLNPVTLRYLVTPDQNDNANITDQQSWF
jgi:prepilin-type processing-associated H-X9-DG protein